MSDPDASGGIFRTALEALPHGVCVYGPDRRVTFVNEAYQRIMAGSEVAVGEHHEDITARRVAQGEYGPLKNDALFLMKADFVKPAAYEQVRERPNGTVISARVLPVPDGGQVVVMTDITAQHRAELEQMRQDMTLHAMLDNQLDGIALFDADGRLVAANSLAARLSGLDPEDMRPGRHVLELRARQVELREIREEDFHAPFFVRASPERPLHRAERYVRRRPNGMLLEVRTTRLSHGGFIRIYRDVTEDDRIRTELEAARDAAEAASRAKSGFLATMTHELRTPLHAVIGFSEAILEETRPEAVRDHAQEVLMAGRQLLGLVDGLLEATRIEAGTLSLRGSSFDPLPVLRAASAGARRTAEAAHLAYAETLPPDLPRLRGDPARLRQVLDALISNAVKFSKPGGHISLEASSGAEGTTIVLRDDGIGMASEDIPRAFEAFTQLEGGLARRYPGSGLGLYLARALAGAMGMTLTLDSQPGQGTTARLAVPPAEETQA